MSLKSLIICNNNVFVNAMLSPHAQQQPLICHPNEAVRNTYLDKDVTRRRRRSLAAALIRGMAFETSYYCNIAVDSCWINQPRGNASQSPLFDEILVDAHIEVQLSAKQIWTYRAILSKAWQGPSGERNPACPMSKAGNTRAEVEKMSKLSPATGKEPESVTSPVNL